MTKWFEAVQTMPWWFQIIVWVSWFGAISFAACIITRCDRWSIIISVWTVALILLLPQLLEW